MQFSTFSFAQQHNVRAFEQNGMAWFVAADICAALELSNSRMAIAQLDDDEKAEAEMQTAGGVQKVRIINESGLYILILRSRKAMEKGTVQHKFRKWVTNEVLPAIRKTGSYELHLDRWLNEWERDQIRAAVKARCERTGESSQAVYRKLHAFMNIPSYEQISATQFQTALNFLASMENAPDLFRQPQAARFEDHEVARLATVVYYCNWACRLLEEVSAPLKALGYGKALTMWTIADESISFLRGSREALERELPNIADSYYRNHIQHSLRRFDAVQTI